MIYFDSLFQWIDFDVLDDSDQWIVDEKTESIEIFDFLINLGFLSLLEFLCLN